MNVTPLAPFSNVSCPVCGKHTRVKREFGPYTLVRRHAVGGMSMVFVARDSTLDREVALKILSEEYSADERRISAFEEEARITASFSHPNVVRVLTTGRAFDRFYIAMELVPGGHFEHQIRERGKIPEAEMLPLAIEVAQGLKAAHAAGLIHRDVKPGNILLDAEGHAKLVDFGLALVTQGGKAQATELWATPYYVPPETIEGFPEDFRSDIYAFGATVYHALAGKPSCGEETMVTDRLREAKQKVVPLSAAEPTISADTCHIIEKAMAYDPQERFGSYDELISQLEASLKRLKSGAPSAAEVAQTASRRRAKKKRAELMLFSSAALVLAGAIGIGIWWVVRTDPSEPVVQRVLVEPLPVIPEEPAFTDIARIYREARGAVASRDFGTAAEQFTLLSNNPAVQEPTRTWAAVEAAAAAYLDGKSSKARQLAKAAGEHAAAVSNESSPVGEALIRMLAEVVKMPVVPEKARDASKSNASHVMSWMLAGLKNWEQGLPERAIPFFSEVVAAKLSPEDQWLSVYQDLARDYLADHQLLSHEVFATLPANADACREAVATIEELIPTIKTRGRARFNMRAWQLDLTRHASLLEVVNEEPEPAPTTSETPSSLAAVMETLKNYANECRFIEAARFVRSLPADPDGATRASLLAITESAAVFLADIEQDLTKGVVAAEFPMKSGETVVEISINDDMSILTTGADGDKRAQSWDKFSPDALISLHRILVRNPVSELERLRRHQCAIAFDWIAGNRERALSAAAQLCKSSPEFKRNWETIASGLPE